MFTYQDNIYFPPALVCTVEKFNEIIDSPKVAFAICTRRRVTADIAAGDFGKWLTNSDFIKFCEHEAGKKRAGETFRQLSEQEKLGRWCGSLKQSLPAFCFGAREFDEVPMATDPSRTTRRRKLEGIHLSGGFMFDVDHVPNPREIYERTQVEGFPWQVLLAHVTSSGEGLRLVCVARPELGNIADNQIALAKALGVEPDMSCIDASRISFAPMRGDIYYVDTEALANYYGEEFDRLYCESYRRGETAPTHRDDVAPTTAAAPVTTGEVAKTEAPTQWRGIDLQAIIDMRYAERRPCREDSNRHAESLKLASDLLIMLDGDKAAVQAVVEAQQWVKEIISERGEDVGRTVESAAESLGKRERTRVTQYPSRAMQQAIAKVAGKSYIDIVRGTNAAKVAIDIQLQEWGEEIATFFDDYPILRDICRGLKPSQYPAALFVAATFMMTLMTRCWYRYFHRPEERRRLNACTAVIGDPASNKSFATCFYKIFMEPVRKADEAGVAALNRFKEESRMKGSNKEKPSRPKAVVRIHPTRTSNAQFILDMINAVEEVDGEQMNLHLLTFDSELDNTLSMQRGGSWINKHTLELKAFHNEEDGQFYSNLDSVMQNFNVYWNFCYTGTPIALKKMVNSTNFGDGLSTRLACIPQPPTNFQMLPRETAIDPDADTRLREWAYRLDATKGELPVQAIVDELYDWTARRMADAEENNSRALEHLVKRCGYYGINASAPFIVTRHWNEMRQDGRFYVAAFKTDDTDWQLAELITRIQYGCQQHFFLSLAEEYYNDKDREAAEGGRHTSKTIEAFNRLPDTFMQEDVMHCFGLNSNTARVRIHRLIKDRLAYRIEDDGEDVATTAAATTTSDSDATTTAEGNANSTGEGNATANGCAPSDLSASAVTPATKIRYAKTGRMMI